MAYKPYEDLTDQQKQLFADEGAYKSFMDTTQPKPKATGTTRQQQVSAIQEALPTTRTDTSALTQATTAAQMVQPTLPSGSTITPELQQARTDEIQTTPGLTQPAPVAQVTAPTAPTMTPTTVATTAKESHQILQKHIKIM